MTQNASSASTSKGVRSSSRAIRIPFLFQGQYYDHETELAYNRFWYYSPELGRYISEDSIRFASGILSLYSYVEDTNQIIDPLGFIHLNKLTAKANFKRYIIYEDEAKKKVLKIGKAKSDDVVVDGKKQRMHNSERQAKKQYPNAFAEEYRDLGYTSTRKAIGAEAKEVRTRRNKGEELPLNREKKKSYRKNS
ncbi:MAG: RHS repeat-associated core domain-containing protein [Bacteroides sp.]